MLSVHQFLYGNGNPFYTKAESDSRYANIDGSNVALAPQFDNSLALANTQWVRRQGVQFATVTAFTSAQTLTLSQAGRLFALNGLTAYNVTLPAAGASTLGLVYRFYATNPGGVTILTQGADTITATGATIASILMKQGDTLELTCVNGSTYVVTGGSLSTKYSSYIADPIFTTPPQFDSTTKLATTAFVQRALGSKAASAVYTATSVTLSSSDIGKLVQYNGTANSTFTLPPAAATPDGSEITIRNTSNFNVTVIPAAGENIGYNSGISTDLGTIVLGNGDTLTLSSIGSGISWRAIGGSALLKFQGVFNYSLTSNGYQKLPSGLIVQWGAAGGVTSTGQVVTYPIAFPNALLAVTATPSFSNATVSCYAATYSTGTPKTSIGISVNTGNVAVGWIAIGY